MKNTTEKPTRYVVYFPKYDPYSEEYCENFTSYNCKLDNIQGMTKAKSLAIASASKYNGVIYQEINGEMKEFEYRHFKD